MAVWFEEPQGEPWQPPPPREPYFDVGELQPFIEEGYQSAWQGLGHYPSPENPPWQSQSASFMSPEQYAQYLSESQERGPLGSAFYTPDYANYPTATHETAHYMDYLSKAGFSEGLGAYMKWAPEDTYRDFLTNLYALRGRTAPERGWANEVIPNVPFPAPRGRGQIDELYAEVAEMGQGMPSYLWPFYPWLRMTSTQPWPTGRLSGGR